jgi:hypothetical protein
VNVTDVGAMGGVRRQRDIRIAGSNMREGPLCPVCIVAW